MAFRLFVLIRTERKLDSDHDLEDQDSYRTSKLQFKHHLHHCKAIECLLRCRDLVVPVAMYRFVFL
jgi:hypothetical protein